MSLFAPGVIFYKIGAPRRLREPAPLRYGAGTAATPPTRSSSPQRSSFVRATRLRGNQEKYREEAGRKYE